ncbi:MipA/OmpV family protein [Deltaproteobacteria bacterium TL4]
MKANKGYRFFYVFSVCFVFPFVLRAETEPHWKVGVGAVAAQSPHYFGSNHYYLGALPYPLLGYRTEHLSAQTADPDRYGQIFVFSKETLLLELDLSARFPVESESLKAKAPDGANRSDTQIIQNRNYTRRGMPNLPLALFIGMKLSWRPIPYILIELPVLQGLTVEGNSKEVGQIFSPTFEIRFLGKQKKKAINLTAIWTHGTQNYNEFYYGVQNNEVLSDRPEYHPKQGLTAITWGPTFTWTPKANLSLVGGYVFHDLNNSVVRNSPLVKTRNSRSWGVSINYTFAESELQIKVW